MLCSMNLRLHQSHVRTAQIGRKTSAEGSDSFLCVVITKSSTLQVAKVVILLVRTFFLFNIA